MPEIKARLRRLRGSHGLITSSVTWCEVLYVIRRNDDAATAVRASRLLQEIGIAVVDVDTRLATYAAEVKAVHGLGLGDSFAAALALATDSPLMTADTDFLPLAEHGLKLDWLG
jgi:predicted nucleic acid-binding protein